MSEERRVVVLVSAKMLTNSETGRHAARILELGLTAYGETADEALRKVKRMYASVVQAHRELGMLEDWLNRTGLNWFWEDEYKGAIPVEDADKVTLTSKRALHAESKIANPWSEVHELRMAA